MGVAVVGEIDEGPKILCLLRARELSMSIMDKDDLIRGQDTVTNDKIDLPVETVVSAVVDTARSMSALERVVGIRERGVRAASGAWS